MPTPNAPDPTEGGEPTGDPTPPPAAPPADPAAPNGPVATTTIGMGIEPQTSDEPPKWRSRLVVLLAILTCVGVLSSTVAVWTHRTLFNTDAWVEAVGPVVDDPDVQVAVAQYLTDQTMAFIESKDLLEQALPEKVQFLATPLSTAIEKFVYDATLKLVQSDQFHNLWYGLNRKGHEIAVNVLEGDTRFVQTADGTVSINLLPIIAKTLAWVQEKVPGLFGDRTVPTDITFDTPTDQARAELASGLQRDLKPTFGVVTLFHSDQLAAVQNAVTTFNKAVWALLIVTIGLFIATIALAHRRWRALMALGGGVAVAMGLALTLIRIVREQILSLITDPTNRSAAAAALRSLLSSFNTIADWLLVLGLVLAVGAFLTGDHKWAQGIRRVVTRGASTAATKGMAAARPVEGPPFPWLNHHRNEVMIAIGALYVAWLVLFEATTASFLVVTGLIVLVEAGIAFLTRRSELDDTGAPGAEGPTPAPAAAP